MKGREHPAEVERAERDRRDVETINRNAKRLNGEALDVLGYQELPRVWSAPGSRPESFDEG